MSIGKHITHYLTEDGKRFFPVWLQRLRRAANETPGFDRIMQVREREHQRATHLILRFENQEGLLNWQHNGAHYDLLSELSPYLLQPSDIRYFFIDADIVTAALK